MKKVLLMMFAVMMTLCSCSKEDKDSTSVGDWEEMVVSVENAKFDTSSADCKIVNIPSDENDFTLKVTNYDDWWIQSVNIKETSTNIYKAVKVKDRHDVTCDWGSVNVVSNQARCYISANTSVESRTIKLEMTAGDVFETIYIVQAGK